jgi:PhzF family phenazine biosynthesis protein
MTLRISQIDAFTNRPFEGNPAAVCLLESGLTGPQMQQIALEMNLSETAFLERTEDGFSLRWFTPALEVDLCGHATLASAHFLYSEGHLGLAQEARFHSRSGLLVARKLGDWIELDFPAEPAEACEAAAELRAGLDVDLLFVGRNRLDDLVEVASETTLRNLQPDFAQLKKLSGRGVIVTARSDSSDFDFVSRYFAPSCGIDEDPVTGSAHCCLGPYWQTKLKKAELTGFQASARGGVVKVLPRGERVLLRGQAVTVLQAQFVDALDPGS